MDEQALRALIEEVKRGRLSRRRFVETLVALGLTAPVAAQLLASAGIAQAQPRPAGFTPTRRGGGGSVKLLYWAATTVLNPHLAIAPKDLEASEIFYEPLADIDTEGNVVPVLARELPSLDNGGVARDGTWVIWRLKPGALWHDGRPFTADDVIFTWQYGGPGNGGDDNGIVSRDRSHRARGRSRGEERLQATDALLGRCLLRRRRHGPAPSRLRALPRRAIA